MLLSTFAYPSPAQFLQYLGWKRGRATLRDKAALQSIPCSSSVLTVPEKGYLATGTIFLRGKHSSAMRVVYLLKNLKKNLLSTVRSIKK